MKYSVSVFICLLICLAAASLRGASIRHSGTMGQSNPEKPLNFIGVTGLVSANGKYYFWNAPALYSFTTPDNIRPAVYLGGHCRQLFGDGKTLWLKNTRGEVYKLECSGRKESLRRILTMKEVAAPFAAFPAEGKTTGWGKRVKLVRLLKNKVIGYDADGNNSGTVLELPANEIYNSIAFLSGSGDLLVSLPYPKCRVLRFKSDGTRFPWDYSQHLNEMFMADGKTFGTDTRLLEIPEQFQPGITTPRTNRDDMYISGVAAAPDGGYYLGTTQGILHYPGNPAALPVRYGGFPGGCALAVNDDGLVLALSDVNRNLIYCLKIDDEPSTPLLSSANQTSTALWNSNRFRKGTALAVSASAGDFLILNRNGCRTELWTFRPRNHRTARPVWTKQDVKHPGTSAVCSTEHQIYLLANGNVFRLKPDGESLFFSEFPVTHFAVSENGMALCGESCLLFLKPDDDGSYRKAWKIKCGKVQGIAVSERGVLLSTPGRLALFDCARGRKKAERIIKEYPGGAVAMKESWIFAADPKKKSIERYKIEE